jgi:hypothetical protein
LPSGLSDLSTDIFDYLVLCYGEKKIGKTSLFSHHGRALFLMFEPGGRGLSIYQEPMPTWSKFVKFVDLLEKDDTFRTVVIDIADLAYDRCMHYVCKQMGIDHPSDEDYGKGWSGVRTEFTRQITRLAHTGKGIVFISHSVQREIKPRHGAKFDRIQPTMSSQARDVLEGMVDIWMYYGWEGKSRRIWLVGDELISAGHRIGDSHFQYTDGTPITKFWPGRSSKQAYDRLTSAFDNKLVRPEKKRKSITKT